MGNRFQRSGLKGKVFERKLAAIFRARWPHVEFRRSSQAERAYQSDVFASGDTKLERMWFEMNDAKTPVPIAKLEQAERDIDRLDAGIYVGSRIPVVVWHKCGSETINVTTRLWVLDFVRGFSAQRAGAPRDPEVVTLELHAFLTMIEVSP